MIESWNAHLKNWHQFIELEKMIYLQTTRNLLVNAFSTASALRINGIVENESGFKEKRGKKQISYCEHHFSRSK